MKKILTLLLLLLSLVSFSQEYYRDTVVEMAIFNEINNYRNDLNLNTVRFNADNTTAVPWGEILVKNDLESGKDIYHCYCEAGIEIIAILVIGDTDSITMSVPDIASQIVLAWEASPSHKEAMEDKYMTRGFNSVYIFKSKIFDGEYVALSVFQFLRDKEYYIKLDWEEDELVPNRFL